MFPVVAALLVVACGEDPTTRREHIYDLKRKPTEENVARIRTLLLDEDRDVRATALNALVGLEVVDARDLVRAGLRDTDVFVRATAAKLAGDVQDPAVAPDLARVLSEDTDPAPRQRAAESLARLGGETAIEALAGALDDPVETVRMAAIDGVRTLDPDRSREELIGLLLGDPSWEVRALAARALGSATDASAVVAHLERALTDANEFVRAAAANALRAHGHEVKDAREIP